MKISKIYLITSGMFALAGVLFVVAEVKDLIKGEPADNTNFVIAVMFFVFASVLLAVSRKSGGGPGTPSA